MGSKNILQKMAVRKKMVFFGLCISWIVLVVTASACSQFGSIGNAVKSPVPENSSTVKEQDALTDKFNQVVMNSNSITTESVTPQELNQVSEPEQIAQPSDTVQSAQPNTIYMKGSAFEPSEITISVGTNITWKNDDSKTHIINMYSGSELSSNRLMDPGDEFSHQFNNAGIFKYQDAVLVDHMRGEITVS